MIMKEKVMQPSTKLGNGLGHSARTTVYLMDYVLPLTVIKAYRMIPARLRGKLFGGPSMSFAALQTLKLQRHSGWTIIRLAMSNHPDRPIPGS